jgi:nucleotide-binding universal stress UspA family protein
MRGQEAAMVECGADTEARIVVGLDGSPASVAALRWAIREARFTGCTVEAVHVWTGSVSPFGDLAHARAGLQSERNAAREVLLTTVEQVRDANPDSDVPVRQELVAGYPSAVLCTKTRGARAVVLGKSRHDDLTRLLHKTVTHAVARHAPCRVVIVAADGLLVSDSAFGSPSP